ncbi:putative multidrug resistance protein [Ananas comosus]|uniref:Multidrug resistance protein n=1 Tax=Ananas comosus TaxID=4615 RepID=A0A6P5FWW6_ANACO|nr:putative multidrug resistance protein [Ananas comosus]
MDANGRKKEKPPSNSAVKSFFSIFMHADAIDKAFMTFGILGAIGDGLSTPVMLYISSKILNDLGGGGTGATLLSEFTHKVDENARNLVFLAMGTWVSAFLEAFCWTRTGERQASTMRARYLKAVLRQDIEFFDLTAGSTTEVITSVSNDSLVIQDVLSEKVPNFIMNASLFVGSYTVGLFLMWRLALATLPMSLLLIIPSLVYGRRLMGLARRIRVEYNKAGSIAEQAVSSVRTVYSFVAEGRTMAKFSAALDDSVKLGLQQGLAKGLAIGSNGITFAIWAFSTWYGSRLVMYHGGKGGTVFAVSAAAVMGGLALGSGLTNVKYFSEASSAGERILEVIQRVPKIDSESTEGEVLGEVRGEIEFKGIEFAYPSRPDNPIFVGLNLKVPAGKTVALVGGSGSGKSTVVALLERFYDPSAGEILLDGVDIKTLRLKWLRSQMGLVSQEPALFATSIKENILFGKEDATMEEIVAAAKAANAHNFISQLPQGYDTQVGERGVQMSGGQKQRIAIARAILKAPKILLLDEATSALDTESERIVQEALDAAAVGRTTLVIAHRLSTIRNADLIAVMQTGDVKELGPHDELIANDSGLYAALVRLQQTRDAREDEEVVGPSSAFASRSSRLASNSLSRRLSSRTSSARSAGGNAENDEDPSAQPAKPPVPSFRRLLMMNAPEWKHAVLGSVCAVLYGAVQPVYAFAMGSVVSVYFYPDHGEIKSKIRTYALVFVGLAMASFSINVGQHYSFGAMGEYLTKRVRERMLAKILTFEVGWFDQDENSSGAISAQLAKDANVVRSLVGDRMALVIQTISAVTIAFTMGLIIAWRLAVVMIAVQPIIIVCFYFRRVLLKSMSKKAIKAQAESSKLAAEAVSNLRTVTAFSSQGRILRLFDAAQEGPARESRRQSWFAGLGLATSMSLTTCTWALDFWYGGKLIRQGHITFKELIQTFMILVSTGRVIADAGSMTTDLAKGADAVASVFAVLDRTTKIEPEDPDGYKPERLRGDIDLHGVDFAYPARPDVIIFKGFSLRIHAGQSTALVGQSGSGKSTIIGLVERFYDPLKGSVKMDGRDVRTYQLRWLRRQVGLVGQEPTLFAGTIRENIVYGAEAATEAEVEGAARAANAHDFISNLKDGYETPCGDRGVQLSGGQKQRIAIARAILKDPAVLLLDEATSALDSQSEKVVQEALDRVMVGRTSVVVAHRLSTVQNCDLIAVLEKGAVVEKGTHASLMAKGPAGTYYGLVSLQKGNRGSDH